MNDIIHVPNWNFLLRNFCNCINWEEKYLYIIELGNCLSIIPKKKMLKKYLVPGCQSKVWVFMKMKTIKEKKIIKLYGNSDSAITKGILCIIFIICKGLTLKELIDFDPYPFLNQLKLNEHLTYSRSQGINSILTVIYNQAKELQKKNGQW